ncbi:zinc finger and BTB domain-containing protein 49 [Engraulis encrasicolus]|uniref:zinc finger and BTB domain-containing protein 49 n=1 Tax=Engraulis encrasicolus TaxID=184585 RepID=UPI002FD5FD84
MTSGCRAMESLSQHSSYLLQQLQEQRIQGMLCDCTIVVKGVCFKAHKNVLAAFSSYFRSLFQNATSQRNDVFHLVIQDVGGIGQVLDYMYTSHLELNDDNVQPLQDVAQYLQVPSILSMCTGFSSASVVDASAACLPISQEEQCMLGASLHTESDDPTETLKPLNSSNGEDTTSKEDSQVEGNLVSNMNSTITGPPMHGYKLRNFYSKLYFKQSAQKSSSSVVQSQNELSVDRMSTESSVGNNSTTAGQNTVMQTSVNTSTPTCEATRSAESDSMSHLSMTVRPKKAVYLKKYNYLCSEGTGVSMPVAESPFFGQCTNEGTQEEQNDLADSLAAETQKLEDSGSDKIEQASTLLKSSVVETCSGSSGNPPDKTENSSYCCEICRKTFKHPSNLELHKRSHTGEKPFQCNICGKNFSQSGNLQTHLRRHSGEKPYICELCGKSFAASGDVQRHIVIHTGEKPHLCDVCGRGFSNFSNLKEHKRTHSTDQAFTCDQCGKTFNMSRKLQRHKICHTGDRHHSCQTCGKRFGSAGDLQRHIRSHSGEKPYSCEMCGKSFTRSSVLRRHHSIHCKSFKETTLSSDRKETQQANKSPLSNPTMSKATRTPDQCFGFCPQQQHLEPRSGTELNSGSSMVVELQHAVPNNHIFISNLGRGAYTGLHSKILRTVPIEVSIAPCPGSHAPSASFAKAPATLATLSASSQSTGALAKSSEHIFPV